MYVNKNILMIMINVCATEYCFRYQKVW